MAMHVHRTFFSDPLLEDSEFSLAISPRPQLEESSQGTAKCLPSTAERGSLKGRHLAPSLCDADDGAFDILPEILTIGWVTISAVTAAAITYALSG